MKKKNVFSILLRATLLAFLLVSCAAPAGTPADAPVDEAPADSSGGEAMDSSMQEGTRIYYADARTWPSQPELMVNAGLIHGKFYVPVQDDGFVAVIDPEAEDPLLKLIPIEAAQPHHPWAAPGMRYMFINHQSEGKGDHNVMTVIDTFTDEVVSQIKTDFDDPFHCAYSPTDEHILLCGDLNPEGGYVYYIDPVDISYTMKVKTTGKRARDVIPTHDGKYAFVGHQGEGNVDVLDIAKGEIVKTLECDLCARLKMTPDGKYVFASSPNNNFTAVIDVASQEIIKKIEFGPETEPGNINFGADGKFALVGLKKSGQLGVVDISTLEVAAILDTGASTNTAYPNSVNSSIAIATNDGQDDWYTVVDLSNLSVVKNIEAGGKATHNIHWSADGVYGVGSDRLGDTVTLFRYDAATGEVEKIASIPVGFGTNGIQWTPYFCGVPYLTDANVGAAKNEAPVNANGDCAE